MLPTREMADRLEREGLVKSSTHEGLTIFKYARKVFYKNLWTPELELFRGTVFKDDKLVVMPLRKMYNYLENGTGSELSDDTEVVLDYKVNGFMLNVTVLEGKFLFSTTGSLNSPFVDLGAKVFYTETSESTINKMKLMEGHTFVFEVVDPSDPHIVKEDSGLHFLALINEKHGKVSMYKVPMFDCFNYHRTMHTNLKFLKARARNCKHEGWVVYDRTGTNILFKMKTKYYLTTKFLMRSKKASDQLYSDDAIEYFKDEEFFGLVHFIRENYLKEMWDSYTEQERRTIIENYFNNGAFK